MKYEVLRHVREQWRVGETKSGRVARLRSPSPLTAEQRYPDGYAGKVISVRAVRDVAQGRLPSLRNMEDKEHEVSVLDLTSKQRERLSSRRDKLVGGKILRVTFDDRHGALASILRKQFDDVEAAEAKADDRFDVDGRRFAAIRDIACEHLAPTVTETGTGNYFVKETPTQLDRAQVGAPAGQTVTITVGGMGTSDAFIGGYITNVTRSETRAIVSHVDNEAVLEGSLTNWLDTDDLEIFDAWSTIQAVLEQLLTDQGNGVTFTTPQVISLFDGTYTELVAPSSGLRPDVVASLTISAASGNTSVISTNVGLGGHTWTWNSITRGHVFLEGFTIRTAVAAKNCTSGLRGGSATFTDMVFDGVGVGANAWVNAAYRVIRCQFQGMQSFSANGTSGSFFEQCTFKDARVGVSTVLTRFEGCTFDGTGIHVVSSINAAMAAGGYAIHNCTFYNIATAIDGSTSNDGLFADVSNCIFHTCSAFAFDGGTDGSSIFRSNYNIFFNCAKIARLDGAEYDDLTAWQGYVSKEGTSPDANSSVADPLLTSPGTGDFSLASGSPAIFTGHGSGVITGSNGVAFDPNNPDIGAWSSGVKPAPAMPDAPTITAAVDDETGTSATLTMLAGSGTDVLSVYYRSARTDTEWTLFGTTRVGSGALQVTGLTTKLYRFVAIATESGFNSVQSNEVDVAVTTGGIADVGEGLKARLRDVSAVTDIIGTRIYHGRAPQRAKVPYMVMSKITGRSIETLAGSQTESEAHYQLDLYANAGDSITDLARETREALAGFSGVLSAGGQSIEFFDVELVEEEDGLVESPAGAEDAVRRIMQEYLIWHDQTVPSF